MNTAADPELPSFLRVSPSEQNKDTGFLKNINKDPVSLIGPLPFNSQEASKTEVLLVNKQAVG